MDEVLVCINDKCSKLFRSWIYGDREQMQPRVRTRGCAWGCIRAHQYIFIRLSTSDFHQQIHELFDCHRSAGVLMCWWLCNLVKKNQFFSALFCRKNDFSQMPWSYPSISICRKHWKKHNNFSMRLPMGYICGYTTNRRIIFIGSACY